MQLKWRIVLAASAAQLALALPHPAFGSCIGPSETRVLWSYPAEGDTGVPIDATMWLVINTWASLPDAWLDDQPVRVGLGGAFDAVVIAPGDLDPDTDHVLRLKFGVPGQPPDAGDGTISEIRFRTGTTRAVTPAAPTVSDYALTTGIEPSHVCRDVISAQDCFDQGQDTLWSFAAASDDALAWLLSTASLSRSTLWPKRCGDPALFTFRTPHLGCVQLQALGVGGKLSAATTYCPEIRAADSSPDAGPAPGTSAGKGCDAGGSGTFTWPGLLASLALLMSRRHRKGA